MVVGGPHPDVGCRKVVYPYWSSKPCSVCRHRRPPRAHHCRHCGSCVLKRDHHCLLVGRCVGLRNQRHFVVFVFWSVVALSLSVSHGAVYAFVSFIPRNSVCPSPSALTRRQGPFHSRSSRNLAAVLIAIPLLVMSCV